MRSTVLAAVAVAAALAGTAQAELGRSATAVATPNGAGAAAALTIRLHYLMTCGQPGPGPAVVTLPSAMHVPRAIASGDVLIGTKPAPSVSVSGHVVTVALPKPPKLTCLSIGPGVLTIVFTQPAGLRNPGAAGAYTVRAQVPKGTFTARLAIG